MLVDVPSDRVLEVERRPEESLATHESVSIVIPTFHGRQVLANVLRTLGETLPEDSPVEVIVVDDNPGRGSPAIEPGSDWLAGTPLKVLRNKRNLGFLGSANRGARSSSGQLLVFLNDDTILLPNWLESVLLTFRQRDRVGVVGGRLVYPNGRLQEAGCLIFADGSAAKFGHGHHDPDDAAFQFVRVADYVTDALLATPRALFDDLGGLDPDYGFGYYEDVDYSFRARRAGFATYYQPQATVVHVEGGAVGTDVSVARNTRSSSTSAFQAPLAE